MKTEELAYKLGYRVTEQGDLVNKKDFIIKGSVDKDGYRTTNIRDGYNKIYHLYFHRLQAFQKYGEDLFIKGIEVRHKNGIHLDNTYENILIGTHKDNMLDIPQAIRIKRSLHASSYSWKHTKYNRQEVIAFHNANGKSYKITMIEFNISSKGTLHFILNGRPKKNTA